MARQRGASLFSKAFLNPITQLSGVNTVGPLYMLYHTFTHRNTYANHTHIHIHMCKLLQQQASVPNSFGGSTARSKGLADLVSGEDPLLSS